MAKEVKNKTAIFIMPRSSSSWEGAEALWITAAGWAVAAEKRFGKAVVITLDRISKPAEVYDFPLITRKKIKKSFWLNKFIPSFFKTLFSDLSTWRKTRDWKILKELDLKGEEVAFIWEKHDLFSGPGRKLANQLGVPFISYVHAPVVWEASRWGVKRYCWGQYLDKIEASNLRKADLVAVVSGEVKKKMIRMGVAGDKVLISPMAVDPNLFLREGSKQVLDEFQLWDKFVIGWTGSFRNFHGLDHVIKAFREVLHNHPEVRLMLVGDGSERAESERLVNELEISDKVIFTGRKKFLEIPNYVSVFNMAVVSAKSAEDFHYSPLKLREYMAAGKAVLAPRAGEIPFIFEDEEHLKLFNAGNVQSIIEGMVFLIKNDIERKEIAENGKKLIAETNTWNCELEKLLKKL